MTATPPPAPGGGPTSDRRVTILAACSVLCTVIALVCLGLLVFTGDKDSKDTDATTASTSSSDNDSSTPESSRPDNLTDAGWSDPSAQCLTGDPWVYAAEGDPGQVVICVHDDLLYQATSDQTEAPEPENFQTIGGFCSSGTNGQEKGQFNYDYGNVGWTEYNGTQRWEYDMYSGKGEQHLADPANLSESHYDAFWTNTAVDLSGLRFCTGGRGSRSEHFLAEYGEPETSTEAASSSDVGPCELDEVRKNIPYEWIDQADSFRYCDGKWSQIGIDRTDAVSDVIEWDGSEWYLRHRDGQTPPGWGKELPCYDEDKLIADGVPYKATGDKTLYVTVCEDGFIRPHPDE